MDSKSLSSLGEIKSKLKFDGFWNWFVTYNDVHTLWRAQPTYFIVSTLFIVGGLITFYHALKSKGRFIQLWIGVICHGLVVEIICYNLPDIDNFWHSPTPIMLLGQRLPLHIIFLYAVFIYTAAITIDKLKLPPWSEPFAVGLMVNLLDYPYDVMSVKFVHWTWHDTDPNIFDRHYHVPWNSYYFHATFAAGFMFWFRFTRRFIIKNNDPRKSGPFCKELLCTLIASCLGMPTGVLLFIPNYHILHDIYNLHSEVTYHLLLAIYVVIIFSGLLSLKTLPQHSRNIQDYLILFYLAIYYLIFFGMALIGNPEAEISKGLHEPIGPCDKNVSMKTAFGQTLYKRKYLCVTDYDESYFGWSCLPDGKPPVGKIGEYYTICGTPFDNRVEYITLMLTITIIAAGVFLNIFLHTTAKKNVQKKKN
ncbi:uncharacterized protein LOC122498122 [Leptopilina heterotoma]|uniref:uncharacterized protein LOC122498122 n=1 Tax=Leptopilina heterotoma TaxID=63436 RepID=UPI001CA94C5D|nr:uncharacterized protein LOC122498122 [Leptopilina heterotoma]